MKVILSAFACDPTKGSEPGNGWSWAVGLANKGYEVHCFTRDVGKSNIDSVAKPDNLYFHYIKLPAGLESLYSLSQASMYLYYLAWQWMMFKRAQSLLKLIQFDLAHHVTWGSIQMGSFLYRLNIPFIFGPAGGGQIAPLAYKQYFAKYWGSELKREQVSNFFQKWNPAFKKMVQKSKVVLVSNTDTLHLVKNAGVKAADLVLDAALSNSFFPEKFPVKDLDKKELKLLWIGRFLPRKGIILNLEVMEKLKAYPDIKLTVVGDGEMRDHFLQTIDKLSLQNQVTWFGQVSHEQVKAIYASHDVFFFTSLRDSCPAQLIEAMAYGLPAVTLDLHGQGLIVDETRGIKCKVEEPSKTVEELAGAIRKLYDDRVLLQNLSKSAYEFAREQTWKRKIDAITEKYYK